MSDLDQNPNQHSDKLSQKRRALIKGSAVAIPAILTLRSGSALAITSLSCAAKIQTTPPLNKPDGTSNTDDNWLRKATDVRTITHTSTNISIDIFKDPSDITKWYNVNTDTADKTAAFMDKVGASNQMTDVNGANTYSYTSTTTGYVTIQVTPDGNITNIYGLSANNGFPAVTDSCFTSLVN